MRRTRQIVVAIRCRIVDLHEFPHTTGVVVCWAMIGQAVIECRALQDGCFAQGHLTECFAAQEHVIDIDVGSMVDERTDGAHRPTREVHRGERYSIAEHVTHVLNT